MVYGETAMVRFNLDAMNNQTRQEAIDALDVHELPTGHAIGQGKIALFTHPFLVLYVYYRGHHETLELKIKEEIWRKRTFSSLDYQLESEDFYAISCKLPTHVFSHGWP